MDKWARVYCSLVLKESPVDAGVVAGFAVYSGLADAGNRAGVDTELVS